MVTLEQIKLLETKLTRAINFVTRLTEENSRLKKRTDELEETIAALKEEKARVEEGIVSALGKLNQFEDAIERSLGHAKAASSVKNNPAPAEKTSSEAPKEKPVVPSAYTVDEETKSSSDEDDLSLEDDSSLEDTPSSEDLDEIEDTGEAELDIF